MEGDKFWLNAIAITVILKTVHVLLVFEGLTKCSFAKHIVNPNGTCLGFEHCDLALAEFVNYPDPLD